MFKQSKNYKGEEVGSIKLTESTSLKVQLLDNGYLDIRTWVTSERWNGPTRNGYRLYLSGDRWSQFKKLMEKIDKKHQELVS